MAINFEHLLTKIMRYEKGYVKNYVALRYGP